MAQMQLPPSLLATVQQGGRVWPKVDGIRLNKFCFFRPILSEKGGWTNFLLSSTSTLTGRAALFHICSTMSSSGSCPTKCDFKHLSAKSELQIWHSETLCGFVMLAGEGWTINQAHETAGWYFCGLGIHLWPV